MTPTTTPDSPARPTRHRAGQAGRRASVRTTALTALGAGLAIALPAILRLPHSTDVILGGPEGPGPSSLTPVAPQDSSDPASASSVAPGSAVRGHATAPPRRTPFSSAIAPPTSASAASSPAATTSTAPGTAAVPALVTPEAAPTTQVSPDLATSYEAQVITLTNAQRATAGCGPLRLDLRIQTAAVAHSVDMRARRYFAHATPDGESPWQRMADAGYPTPSAENIAMGQATPRDVVTAWMNSPGHRADILNCSSRAIGVGVQFGAGGPWWTQDFGYA